MNSRVARIAQRTAFRVVPPPRGGFPTNDPPAEKNRTIKHHVYPSDRSGLSPIPTFGGITQSLQNGSSRFNRSIFLHIARP